MKIKGFIRAGKISLTSGVNETTGETSPFRTFKMKFSTQDPEAGRAYDMIRHGNYEVELHLVPRQSANESEGN